MLEFLQANAWWIVVAGLFVLMMRLHGAGAGMDHGTHQHEPQRDDVQPEMDRLSLTETPEGDKSEEAAGKEKQPTVNGGRRQGGCF